MGCHIWKGAEAYYFLQKWHRFYCNEEYSKALFVASHLQAYTNFIPASVVYIVLAISAFTVQMYGVCSAAFAKLQLVENVREKCIRKMFCL